MFKLILHDIVKHFALFALIGLMVIVLCFYLIIGMNTVFSVSDSLRRAVAQNMTGDLLIASAQAKRLDVITKEGETDVVPLPKSGALLEYLRSHAGVANASPRLRVWGYLKSNVNESPVIVTGVDPASEPELLPHRHLVEGRWIGGPNEIEMYFRHSDYLSASLGETLGLTVMTSDGYANYDNLELAGIFDYEDLAYYSEYAFFGFVSLDYLNQLLQNSEPVVSEIFVRLDQGMTAKRLGADIEKRFPGEYRFVLPHEAANLIDGIYKLVFFAVYAVALLLLVMVYLSSSFLINLLIEMRRREIGVYLALGVSKWRIGALFGGELLAVLLATSGVGFSLGLWAMRAISETGIRATLVPLHLVFGRSVLFVHNDPRSYLIVAGILALAFFATTLKTILRMTKLDPIEVMREI